MIDLEAGRQISHERFSVFAGYIFAGILERMDNTVLNLCLGEPGFNSCGESMPAKLFHPDPTKTKGKNGMTPLPEIPREKRSNSG